MAPGDGDAALEMAVVDRPAEAGPVRIQVDADGGGELAGVDGGTNQRGRCSGDADGERAGGAVAGEGEAQDRRDGQGRDQAGDDGRAVTDPPAQLVERDGGDQSPCSRC